MGWKKQEGVEQEQEEEEEEEDEAEECLREAGETGRDITGV